MYLFDFKKTWAIIREATEAAHVVDVNSSTYASLRTTLETVEAEAAMQAVEYLYELLVRRDQFTGAAHLIAWALPVTLRGEPRMRVLFNHALIMAQGSATSAEELLRARRVIDAAADDFARCKEDLTPSGQYWLSAVRLGRARSALEFGCGSALNVIHAAAFDAAIMWSGCDPNADQVAANSAQAQRLGVSVDFFQHGDRAAAERKFDSVALLHVLEHTAYPYDVLADAERYLVTNGVVTITMPMGAWHVGSIAPLGALSPHVNVADLSGLIALCQRRGRLLDARLVPAEGPGAINACAVYCIERS